MRRYRDERVERRLFFSGRVREFMK